MQRECDSTPVASALLCGRIAMRTLQKGETILSDASSLFSAFVRLMEVYCRNRNSVNMQDAKPEGEMKC
jgi:hypothetical protein